MMYKRSIVSITNGYIERHSIHGYLEVLWLVDQREDRLNYDSTDMALFDFANIEHID